MSQNNLTSKNDKANSEQNAQEKRRRRPRSDQDGRNFSCSCGKSYLSYPALYTHIKTKHNGKAQYNRMPPKQQLQDDQQKQEQQQQQQRLQDLKNIQNFRKYLNKYFPFINKDKEIQKKIKELSKQDQLYIKNIKEYWDKHKKQEQHQFNGQTYATTIDHVFGKFLVEVQNQLSKNSFRFLIEFIINLRNAINQVENNQKFCKTNCAATLPLLMNNIYTDVFQKMEENHIYSKHPILPIKTIYHFSRWLFTQKFTNHSLKFNTL